MTIRNTQRLYMPMPLQTGAVIDPSEDQTHYLMTVLRMKDGAKIRLFNETDGEFLASIAFISRKKITFLLDEQICIPQPEPDLILAFAPIRRQRMEAMIEKATELGVTQLAPVLTEFTQTPQVNLSRLQLIATEAAEQSGRISIPNLIEPQRLDVFCNGLNGQEVIFCDESLAGEKDAHILSFIESLHENRPSIVLIGPEGGFSNTETRLLMDQRGIHGVSLGSNILRSDTAAVLALGLWQATLK